ncbi:MAG: carbohydrate kinase family protein [Angustibacter sp.]
MSTDAATAPAPSSDALPDQSPAAPVLVIGEALVDVVIQAGSDPATATRHVGGSPANVAGGLARLGHVVTLAARIGADPDGDLITRLLRADGVRLAPESAPSGRTSTAIATIDQAGIATYAFDLTWDLPTPDVSGAGHLHVGSIAANVPPGAASVHAAVRAARERGTTVSYDPNLRPAIIAAADAERPGVEALVAAADVVKVSEEDLTWLYPDAGVEDVARQWASRGPALVVVTRGGAGATAWRRSALDDPYRTPPRRVEVVDTVGAGDSFMSGLLCALLDAGLLGVGRRPVLDAADAGILQAALAWATLTSAITCTRAGSDPPWRHELVGELAEPEATP